MDNTQPLSTLNARQLARQMAMQALYSWQVSGNHIQDVELHLLEQEANNSVDIPYFKKLIHEIPKCVQSLDADIAKYVTRSLGSVNPVELAILRIGVYELQCQDIPFRVVINEGIELAKNFGADQGHKFVNGILDKVSKDYQQKKA